MFYDWLTIEQDHGVQLPLLGDVAYQRLHIETGEAGPLSAPVFQHKGSFCDTVSISIRGSVLKMSGNPSRWGRLDNLFGLPTVDACVAVYNCILADLGLPQFSRCTRIWHRQAGELEKAGMVSDGAMIRELHITENRAVGAGNVRDYIAGVSTLRYRNSIPRLHSNGASCDWLSKLGNAHLIYPTVYDKAHEMGLHAVDKIKRQFGDKSAELAYVKKVQAYCAEMGVVRFEQKLKSRYLQRENLMFWGLADYSCLDTLNDNFTNLDKTLQVTSMDIETISEHLISSGVVSSTLAANTSALYAMQWMHGHTFDFGKRQVQQHRARLRKIGIDIAQKCNVSKFSPVVVVASREVSVSACPVPSWYQSANHLRVA